MANGEYGHGVIERIIRPLGIGSISPKGDSVGKSDEAVIFPERAVVGGSAAFDKLREGDRVKYRKYPSQLGGLDIAEDVIPE